MSATAVTAEERSGAFWITLSRPPLNVLDIATIRQLDATLRPLGARPRVREANATGERDGIHSRRAKDAKVIVIRSALPGVFSAGVDVRDHVRERVPEMLEAFHGALRLLHELPQATIAAVDGRCLGGGCELIACCDLVLATEASTFGQPEIDLACFPPFASALLPRLIGRAAHELVLGGAAIPAREAERIGLITRVVTDLEAETTRWTERLSAKSRAALALARRALREGSDGPLWEAVGRTERLYREDLMATEDAEEGIRSFLEKRPPRWRDR